MSLILQEARRGAEAWDPSPVQIRCRWFPENLPVFPGLKPWHSQAQRDEAYRAKEAAEASEAYDWSSVVTGVQDGSFWDWLGGSVDTSLFPSKFGIHSMPCSEFESPASWGS